MKDAIYRTSMNLALLVNIGRKNNKCHRKFITFLLIKRYVSDSENKN